MLQAQLIIAAIMTGIIWQVQLLTYPQFHHVSASAFPRYHRRHTSRMAWLVIPPMLAEFALAGLWLWQLRDLTSLVGFLLVAALWLVTGICQVPLHRSLARGKDESAIRRLVITNWLRTLLWSVRLGLLACVS